MACADECCDLISVGSKTWCFCFGGLALGGVDVWGDKKFFFIWLEVVCSEDDRTCCIALDVFWFLKNGFQR